MFYSRYAVFTYANTVYSRPNFTRHPSQEDPNTLYPDASMRRIGRRLRIILEYNNRVAHAKYPRYIVLDLTNMP
ncbi:hypothetical protein Tco_1148220, partial [Tanacetum coccineum]